MQGMNSGMLSGAAGQLLGKISVAKWRGGPHVIQVGWPEWYELRCNRAASLQSVWLTHRTTALLWMDVRLLPAGRCIYQL